MKNSLLVNRFINLNKDIRSGHLDHKSEIYAYYGYKYQLHKSFNHEPYLNPSEAHIRID